MTSREFFLHRGQTWFVRTRESVRRDESETHVTLELVSDYETRVVSCLREEWEVRTPDFAGLLARSVASGASHHITPPLSGQASEEVE
jgi:hypothetical protein